MSSSTRKLVALHLVANALLLWLGYEWLSVAESTRVRLALSALDIVAILTLVGWLHGATFVYFRGEGKINESFRIALRYLAPLVVAMLLVIAIYGLLAWAANASAQPAFQLASWMTLHLRKPVKPAAIARSFQAIFWIVRWVLLPVALLPILARIAARDGKRTEFSWRYWVGVPLLLLAGLQLPFVLLRWIPPFDLFALQFASFAVRAFVAYLLFVASVMMLAYVTAPPARN